MNGTRELEGLLLQEWSTGLRLTTIPQAMERLGLAQGLEWRWRAALRLERTWRRVLLSPEKQQQIGEALSRQFDGGDRERWRGQVDTWGLASILLTENEKLAARYVLWRHRQALPLPAPRETAEVLGIPMHEVHNSFRMLGRLGFLAIADGRRPARYQLSGDWSRFTEGLGFSFHTVSLDNGERFGVPWAVDFLLLVSSQYRDRRLTLDDACAHCVDPISIEVDRGRLARVSPEGSLVYRVGTWGQNNLFRSEEHLREWNGGELPHSGHWSTVARFLETMDRPLEPGKGGSRRSQEWRLTLNPVAATAV